MRKCVRVCVMMALIFGLVSAVFAQAADVTPYQTWAKFKVGATVKYKQTSEMVGMNTESEVVYSLLELTPEKAVVEMSGVTVMGGNKIEMPKTKLDYPAKMNEPDPASATEATAPKADVKQGEGEIEVAGGKLKCKTVESNITQGDAVMTSKIWVSDEVPGSLVKSVTTMEKPIKSTTTITLVEKK